MKDRWNRNIHYHPLVHQALQQVGGRVLDVGCGEGQLTRALAANQDRWVVGIDSHAPSIELARTYGSRVEYIVGDFASHPFEPESLDAIVSVSALHHMNLRATLVRVRDLLRPCGVFAAIGLARSGTRDLPWDLMGLVTDPFVRAGRKAWQHPSPIVWPPPLTFRQVRAVAEATLLGVVYRRHVLFRYSLNWQKPAS